MTILDYLRNSQTLAIAPVEDVLADLQTAERTDDRTAWTFGAIATALGEDVARVVTGTIDAAGGIDPLMKATFVGMSTIGITLYQPERQAMLDQMAAKAKWPDEMTAAVKALGGVSKPRWQQQGFESLPTSEEIAAAQARIVRDSAFAGVGDHVMNEIVTPFLDQPDKTMADVAAALAAYAETLS